MKYRKFVNIDCLMQERRDSVADLGWGSVQDVGHIFPISNNTAQK